MGTGSEGEREGSTVISWRHEVTGGPGCHAGMVLGVKRRAHLARGGLLRET